MTKIITLLAALLIAVKATHADETAPNWDKDQLEIIEVNRWVPLAPKEAGYEAYAALFHPDYTNWYMVGDKEALTTRAQFLGGVKRWLDAGNYATFSKVVPISVEVFGDIAYIRHLQEEHFHHPDGEPTMFVGHFASLMKKHNGKWTFYRTSFQHRYRGPIEGSEVSLDKY
jgi:ketosteroid isomerase-like protein